MGRYDSDLPGVGIFAEHAHARLGFQLFSGGSSALVSSPAVSSCWRSSAVGSRPLLAIHPRSCGGMESTCALIIWRSRSVMICDGFLDSSSPISLANSS